MAKNYPDAILECELITKQIVTNSYSAIMSIQILNETVDKVGAAAAGLSETVYPSDLTLSRPIFLPAVILKREVESLNLSIEQLKIAVRKRIRSTIDQLKHTSENEGKWGAPSSNTDYLDLAKKYNELLIKSIAELESIEAIIIKM